MIAPMGSEKWETVQESELRRFLRGARPDWRASDLAAAENKIRRVGIDRAETLIAALVPARFDPDRVVLNDMFEMDDLAPFDSVTLQGLQVQASRPLPRPRTVVQTRDEEAAAAAAKEVAPQPSRFDRFFEGEGEEGAEGPRERLSYAERRSQHEAWRAQHGDAAALREKRLEAHRRKGREQARAEFEATWKDADDAEVREEDDTFEVVHSMAIIKEAAKTDAPDLGVVRRGECIQVQPRRVQDEDGHDWVELTYLELLRSCSASKGSVTMGFVLIDGTHLGLGPLLRGPIHRSEPGQGEAEDQVVEDSQEPASKEEAAEVRAEEAAPQQEAAPLQEAAKPCVEEQAPKGAPQAPAPKAEEAPPPQPETRGPAASPAAQLRPKKLSGGKAPKLLPHPFKVSHPEGAAVREGPSASELQLCVLPDGETVELEEETFDGWAKLAVTEGWVCRCSYDGKRLVTYLTPAGKPPLLSTTEVLPEPGPRQFEVVLRPRVAVKQAPRPTAKLLGNKAFGERVLGMSQTYDGWIRLAGSEGWVLGIGRESGQMLRCCEG